MGIFRLLVSSQQLYLELLRDDDHTEDDSLLEGSGGKIN
jgi:hypothetical protein